MRKQPPCEQSYREQSTGRVAAAALNAWPGRTEEGSVRYWYCSTVRQMRGTFAVSKYVAKAMLVRRWTARIVWGMQRQAAAQILATWRANAFLRSRSQSAAAGGSPAVGAAVPPARALGTSTGVGILLVDLD